MNTTTILLALGIMAVLGVLFGIILTIADKKFAVEVDPRVEAVRQHCGGANCGACGYAGCDAFAQAVVNGEAPVDGCSPAGAKGAAAIGKVMGVSVNTDGPRKVARIVCQGEHGIANMRYEYDGYSSCALAAGLAGSPKLCRFACLGLGDCAKVCNFGAITVSDGIAHIDEDKCTACGQCVKACPKSVIKLMADNETVIVSCRNTDNGREARAACMKACIACGRCVKECPVEAIEVKGGVAVIDQDKCVRCGFCAKVCPTKAIKNYLA